MKRHDKLVRDKIPEIIQSNGDVAHFHRIDSEEEYLEALLRKDIEEGKELAADPCLDELADKLEVLYAIAKTQGFTPSQIEEVRLEKRDQRGGFDDRIFLESTE